MQKLRGTFFQGPTLSQWGFVIISLSLMTPLFGLPPTRFGFFHQIESVVLSFWFTGGFAGIWLYALYRQKPYIVSKVFSCPLVWGSFLLGVISFVLGVFHTVPLRNWTGSAQLAEGSVTFFSLSFLAFLGITLSYIRAFHKPILGVAFFSSLILCALTIIGSPNSYFESFRYWEWAPVFFTNFLGFYIISVLGIYVVVRSSFRRPLITDIFFGVYACVVLLNIDNNTITYGLLIALLSMGVVSILGEKYRKWVFFATPLLITLGLFCLIAFYNSDFITSILPQKLAHLDTLKSRTNLVRASYIDLVYKPWDFSSFLQLIFGNGWGSYGNAVTSNLFLVEEVSLFKGEAWSPTWEFLNRDLMHSHNSFTEVFCSLGLVGVVVFLGIQSVLFYALPKRQFRFAFCFLIILMVMRIMWFQLPNTLTFTTLAAAFLLRKTFVPLHIPVKKVSTTIGVLSSIILFWLPWHGCAIFMMTQQLTLSPGKNILITAKSYKDSFWKEYESLFGGQRHINHARAITFESLKVIHKFPNEDHTALIEACYVIASDLNAHHLKGGNILYSIVANNIFGELATSFETKPWFMSNPMHLKTWKETANGLLNLAPFRGDLMIPLLNQFSENGKNTEILEITGRILMFDPNHPVGLWFKGSVLLQNNDTFSKGILLLQESIKQGISRYMPIPEVEKNKIMNIKLGDIP